MTERVPMRERFLQFFDRNFDRGMRYVLLLAAVATLFSFIALRFFERADRKAACIEALRSPSVSDLARDRICRQ